MEKYAVDELPPNKPATDSKQANVTDTPCPECGGQVERHGNVMLCKKCGSAPFERSNRIDTP